MPGAHGKSAADHGELLAPLIAQPERSGIFCDIDGTIAPIVERAEEAMIPRHAREILTALSGRYALVGCVSGRQAADARRIVGIGSIAYIGNHGIEYLAPGALTATRDRSLEQAADRVRAFADAHHGPQLRSAGIRLEDKRTIWAFHWRSAPDEQAARALLEGVAEAARDQGLVPHWGRKVLEVRLPTGVNKGTGLKEAVREANLRAVLYGGDDTTDLDAFRELRELRDSGELEQVVCVGVRSSEGPSEITRQADIVVEGTEEFTQLLATLAGRDPGDAVH